jgi:hypothetical protein
MARITVRVTPRASQSVVAGWDGDLLRLRVTAAPTDGNANAAVVALLAKTLSLPRSSVRIVAGATSRTKIIDVDGRSLAQIRAATMADAR